MPDRLIRDELLESDRWLGLPTDTDRLAFIGLRLKSDDFGNIEGGIRRLSRMLQGFTHIKTDEAAATTLLHLCDADMIRRYEADGREFYHLPRGRPAGSYLVRKCPASPWCKPDVALGKHVRAVRKQGLAKNLPGTSQERNPDVSQGVGVGVGIVEKHVVPSPKVGAPPTAQQVNTVLEGMNVKSEKRQLSKDEQLAYVKANSKAKT